MNLQRFYLNDIAVEYFCFAYKSEMRVQFWQMNPAELRATMPKPTARSITEILGGMELDLDAEVCHD